MALDPRSAERLPFHDSDEAAGAHAGEIVPARDAQTRHLQRVPLFSGFDEDELGRVAEISKIVEVPVGTVITHVGDRGIRSSSSSTAWRRCERRSARATSSGRATSLAR